ncbi:predicted protein [Sclerotinia sclerotiorum 1980 UF-70]|uniref:Uncharacterized protein n=1 Tax=Sclerotinia sclerotiorum (strain ATCC 18683 / 1980 / Ss-1) TaxID=665079 RepID=A7EFD8_SCLS1|nr:predicted protein [Sclerotinia sclerotiorum 1980 UF-70]EDO01554.1 predicted protein [Sclerotinia sclerotiorum 1980 UF-70]
MALLQASRGSAFISEYRRAPSASPSFIRRKCILIGSGECVLIGITKHLELPNSFMGFVLLWFSVHKLSPAFSFYHGNLPCVFKCHCVCSREVHPLEHLQCNSCTSTD